MTWLILFTGLVNVKWNLTHCFFMPPQPRLAGIEHSGCPYICMSVDQINIFVQGRISRPINSTCSKLIFHLRMYLYETSRNIQEP